MSALLPGWETAALGRRRGPHPGAETLRTESGAAKQAAHTTQVRVEAPERAGHYIEINNPKPSKTNSETLLSGFRVQGLLRGAPQDQIMYEMARFCVPRGFPGAPRGSPRLPGSSPRLPGSAPQGQIM